MIKTDAYLNSTDLHCIADAHSLPFEDDTFGYVYSLAVFEHLHSPWVAAEEIYRVLKPGGKVFTLTAFMQHLHGYPNHFFNMTTSGLKRVFNSFEVVHCKPSKHSNISQLGHILADLNQFIVDSNFKQSTQKKFLELRESIGDFCNLIAELDIEIMGNFEAQLTSFSKFCPAVELVGIKKA
ncbi:MAG: SAM-dependent methyltransferase [Bacteroidetes bacterium]|nr:SAM-dependent methyltransferase [Bacteroidota bacterium]